MKKLIPALALLALTACTIGTGQDQGPIKIGYIGPLTGDAASYGIDPIKVRYLNFFIGSALAAVAGVFISLLSNLVEPTMGGVPAYKALAIIVLGGLGNVTGTLIASLVLGVVEAFGTIYIGHLMDRDAIAFAVLIVVLMIRPQGIFSRR